MKKSLILFVALISTAFLFAQPPGKGYKGQGQCQGKGQGKGGMRQEQPFKELNLSEAQQTKMKEINANFQSEMKKLRDNENQTVKAQRDAMATLSQQHKAQIKQVLTPEQQQKMVALREEKRKEMDQRQDKQFEKMAEQLKLTDTQKTQLTQQREKNRETMHAIMENEGLDRTAKQAKVKAMQEQHKKDMEKVLTKEQLKQWEEMQKNRMQKGPKMQGMHRHGVV
jgi:Spy/CpxP family protein refolding chaperone